MDGEVETAFGPGLVNGRSEDFWGLPIMKFMISVSEQSSKTFETNGFAHSTMFVS